ncbi:hypothetical protein ERJ75_000498800 [Trypanosoma vivax]|nr:hypothetical protein ERJ75_001309600 [Trypanosoma vivax]KAH8616239.1 hypothetical protein ERJ75_000498800 [Trypanosoma vivax]
MAQASRDANCALLFCDPHEVEIRHMGRNSEIPAHIENRTTASRGAFGHRRKARYATQAGSRQARSATPAEQSTQRLSARARAVKQGREAAPKQRPQPRRQHESRSSVCGTAGFRRERAPAQRTRNRPHPAQPSSSRKMP